MEKLLLLGQVRRWSFVAGSGMLAFLLLSCTNTATHVTLDPAQLASPVEAYVIGPTDVLDVVVWKNDSLSKVVTVRPDGYISLPLVNDVKAAGLNALQLRDDLVEKIAPFYKEPPQVSVIVQQANSSVVYVLGEVLHPGRFQFTSGTTLLQGIVLAGGLTPLASSNKILLIRNADSDGQIVRLQVRFKDLISEDSDTNIVLQPGDTIFVP